jgi:hypothetical protein
MAQASLKLPITDVLNEPIAGAMNVSLQPEPGSPGGFAMSTGDVDLGGSTELVVGDVECRGGPGTLYRVAVNAANYKTYSFFQMMMEDRVNKSPDNQIRLVVNPGKVKDITAPAFAKLAPKLQAYLEGAAPIALEAEDRDLVGAKGETLYNQLGALRKAAILNLIAKARHATAGGAFRFLENQTLLLVRQDRFFTTIHPDIEAFLTDNQKFKSASDILHEPLRGYERRGSFKSKDSHANLQISLMRNATTGEMAADVDIDEAAGFQHSIEVIRNKFRGRTNPYLVRDLLILSDVEELTLDPGYRFVLS